MLRNFSDEVGEETGIVFCEAVLVILCQVKISRCIADDILLACSSSSHTTPARGGSDAMGSADEVVRLLR